MLINQRSFKFLQCIATKYTSTHYGRVKRGCLAIPLAALTSNYSKAIEILWASHHDGKIVLILL